MQRCTGSCPSLNAAPPPPPPGGTLGSRCGGEWECQAERTCPGQAAHTLRSDAAALLRPPRLWMPACPLATPSALLSTRALQRWAETFRTLPRSYRRRANGHTRHFAAEGRLQARVAPCRQRLPSRPARHRFGPQAFRVSVHVGELGPSVRGHTGVHGHRRLRTRGRVCTCAPVLASTGSPPRTHVHARKAHEHQSPATHVVHPRGAQTRTHPLAHPGTPARHRGEAPLLRQEMGRGAREKGRREPQRPNVCTAGRPALKAPGLSLTTLRKGAGRGGDQTANSGPWSGLEPAVRRRGRACAETGAGARARGRRRATSTCPSTPSTHSSKRRAASGSPGSRSSFLVL